MNENDVEVGIEGLVTGELLWRLEDVEMMLVEEVIVGVIVM